MQVDALYYQQKELKISVSADNCSSSCVWIKSQTQHYDTCPDKVESGHLV